MRTHAMLSRFTLALSALLGLSASPALAQPSLVQVAQPQVSVLRLLPGDWLGPFPAPGGQCSTEYLEWFIYGKGSYTSTWNSYPQYGTNGCGGATAYGRWSVRGDVLTFRQQSVPGAPSVSSKKPFLCPTGSSPSTPCASAITRTPPTAVGCITARGHSAAVVQGPQRWGEVRLHESHKSDL
jgi:hypothetical protein